jgi:hypothetical protein
VLAHFALNIMHRASSIRIGLTDLEQENAILKQENAILKQRVTGLEGRVATLEGVLGVRVGRCVVHLKKHHADAKQVINSLTGNEESKAVLQEHLAKAPSKAAQIERRVFFEK